MQKQDDRPLLPRGPIHGQIDDVVVNGFIDGNGAIEKSGVLLAGVGGGTHARDYGEEHSTQPVAGHRTQAARRLETKHRQLEHTGSSRTWVGLRTLGMTAKEQRVPGARRLLCIRARLQSCRLRPRMIRALAPANSLLAQKSTRRAQALTPCRRERKLSR